MKDYTYVECMDALVKAVREECEDTCSSFTLEITAEAVKFQFHNNLPKDYSMRNLRGKWIKKKC